MTNCLPASAAGPDVWEVIKALQEIDERDTSAIDAVGVLAYPGIAVRVS